MADDVTSTTTTPETPATPAAVETPKADAATIETPPVETSILDDYKAEVAKLNGEEPKPDDKPKPTDAKAETNDKGDEEEEKEPEFQTPEEKNRAAWLKKQRDENLAKADAIAKERKEIEEAKATLEKEKAEIAAAKPKTEEKQTESGTQTSELEHFKPITLASYEDGDNPNELALKDGLEGLAKDVLSLKTLLQSKDEEIAGLKSNNERLMQLAAPHLPDPETGIAPVVLQAGQQFIQTEMNKASEILMGEFGPDSGLQLDPINLLAAFKEFHETFTRLGEIKPYDPTKGGLPEPGAWGTAEAIIHCWKHAHKTEIDAAKAKATTGTPEARPKAPPLGDGHGKATPPVKYEDLSPAEQMLHDYKKAAAALNGRR